MKKIAVFFVLVVIIFSVGVLADSKNTKKDIVDFVKHKGIVTSEENIAEVNFSDLPNEVDIEKVDNTSVVIYKVDYGAKPLFVISSGSESVASPAPVCEVRSLLEFGSSEKMGSGFLNMAGGAEGSLEKGYVMMRAGSISGISSNLEILKSVNGGSVEVIIYINGEEIGFRNILSAGSVGVVSDYDVLSKGIVNFEAGDVVSVYLNSDSGVSLRDVSTTIEITG